MKKVVACLMVVMAVSSGLASAQSPTETEVAQAIRASYEYTNTNNKVDPGAVSQHGSQEFFSNGGPLLVFTPESPPEEFAAYDVQPRDIRVIPLVEGQAAVAHFYAEGSITFTDGNSISDYHARVTRVYVKEAGRWKVRASHFSRAEAIPIVAVFDASGQTIAQYEAIVAALEAAGAGSPEGRLYHVAYPKGSGYVVVDVWASAALLEQFSETLVPIVEKVGAAPVAPDIAPVHNVIAGGAWTTQDTEAIVAVFDGSDQTVAQYEEVIEALEAAGAGSPEGRLYHVCYSKGSGYVVVDVWASSALLEQFSETLIPIVEKTGATPATPDVAPVQNVISLSEQ